MNATAPEVPPAVVDAYHALPPEDRCDPRIDGADAYRADLLSFFAERGVEILAADTRRDVPPSLIGHPVGPCSDPDCEVDAGDLITDAVLADPGAAGLTRDDLIAEVTELAQNADMTPHEALDAFLEGRAEVLADDALCADGTV